VYAIYFFLLFCKLIFVIVVNNNEPCRPKLHSLVVRLVSYISTAARGEWCGNAMERRSGNILEPDGAPANIVDQRWNANTEAFRQIASYSLG